MWVIFVCYAMCPPEADMAKKSDSFYHAVIFLSSFMYTVYMTRLGKIEITKKYLNGYSRCGTEIQK